MSFLSMKFLLFLAAAVAGYYVIPRQLQWVWLLIFSYIFYLASEPGGGSVHPDHYRHYLLGGLWLEHTDRALACALDRTLARDPDRTPDCGPDHTLDCGPDHTLDCGPDHMLDCGPDRLRRLANPQQPLSPDEKGLKGAVQTAQEMDCCPGPLCKLRHSGSIKIPQLCRR